MKRRQIINGMLRCALCKLPRPLSWYGKDKNSLLGVVFRCRNCQPRVRKTEPVNPTFTKVLAAQIPASPRGLVKVERNYWHLLVRNAALLPPTHGLRVVCEPTYAAHRSTEQGLRAAAVTCRVRLYYSHDTQAVYIRAAKTVRNNYVLQPGDTTDEHDPSDVQPDPQRGL